MHSVTLSSQFARDRAISLIYHAPPGYVVTVAEPKRTGLQNDRLWALLSDVSVSKPQGIRHTPEEWKSIFMAACGWDVIFLDGLDGRPFPAGFRSSKMSKSQMSTLQDFIEAWGSENGVRWSNEGREAA